MQFDKYVRTACLEDAYYIASNLRNADRQEIEACYGERGKELYALQRGIEESEICLTISEPQGTPAALLGVVCPSNNWGRVWLLGTNGIEAWSLRFLRHTKEWLERLNFIYPVLYNAVDTRNTLHVKWLKWCGFQFMNTYQKNNTTFQFFMRGGIPSNVRPTRNRIGSNDCGLLCDADTSTECTG